MHVCMWYAHGFASLLAVHAHPLSWLYLGTGNCDCLISTGQLDLTTASRNVVKGLKIKNYREDREFEIENWEGKEVRE